MDSGSINKASPAGESNSPLPDRTARRRERLVVLALAGGLTLNYPLLQLFDDAALVFGIPTLYLYLFLVWGTLIGLGAWVLEGRGRRRGTEQARTVGHRPP